MTERGDQICECGCHWPFSWLNEAFPNSFICVSDIDGLFVVERKESAVFIETKHPGESLPDGQRILGQHLSKKAGQFYVVMWGNNGYPESWQWCVGGVWGRIGKTSREKVITMFGRWYNKANRGAYETGTTEVQRLYGKGPPPEWDRWIADLSDDEFEHLLGGEVPPPMVKRAA
jgi:hypothetical protein